MAKTEGGGLGGRGEERRMRRRRKKMKRRNRQRKIRIRSIIQTKKEWPSSYQNNKQQRK